MPLKCLRGEEELYAFNFETADDWDALRKSNATTKDLRMPCCGAAVVLRTSKLGTRHFAHARKGPCTTVPETAEHLLAKLTIVEGIRRAGWEARPEQSGTTPEGEEWRADVMAVKGKARVAFEVQWSRQTPEETHRRQERYAAAGVRGLWLFRHTGFPSTKDTPGFCLLFNAETKTFRVGIRGTGYWSPKNASDDSVWRQIADLPAFIEGALTGRLRYAPAIGERMQLAVEAASTPCWRCKKETKVVTGLTFAASRVLPGCEDLDTDIYQFEKLPDGIKLLGSLLPRDLLRKHGIGTLKPRSSKTEGRAYLSNGCVHCDALQGRFFDHDLVWEGGPVLEVEVELSTELATGLGFANLARQSWWFDERSPIRLP